MIDPETLTPEQQAGTACVVDGHPVYPGAIPVGVLGDDLHFVYACPGRCARQVDALVMKRDPDPADRPDAFRAGRSAASTPAGRPATPSASRPVGPTREVSR